MSRYRKTREITHPLGRFSKLIFSATGRVQAPSDAPMEPYRQDLSKVTNFFVCAPFAREKIGLQFVAVGGCVCAISGTGIRYLVRRYSWHTGAVFGGVSSSLSPQTLPVSGELRAPVTCIRKGGKEIAQPQPHPTRSHPTRFASFTADPTNPLSALLQTQNPQPSHPHYENTRQGGNTLWNRLQQVHLSHNYNHLTNLYM